MHLVVNTFIEVDWWEMVIQFFKLFYNHHVENGINEVMYSLIFIDNILICYKNIYQMLKHVCVVLLFPFSTDDILVWTNGLGEAIYYQI